MHTRERERPARPKNDRRASIQNAGCGCRARQCHPSHYLPCLLQIVWQKRWTPVVFAVPCTYVTLAWPSARAYEATQGRRQERPRNIPRKKGFLRRSIQEKLRSVTIYVWIQFPRKYAPFDSLLFALCTFTQRTVRRTYARTCTKTRGIVCVL